MFKRTPKQNKSRPTGNHYEALALNYLQQQGLKLVQKNFSSRFGEIDLILKDNQTLVFTEVKFRSRKQYGSALESITYNKQQKIILTAKFFLSQHPKWFNYHCRFDAIGIELDSHDQAQYHWIQAAFME